MNFSGVISIDKSDVHAKGQGQRSKVKVREVKTQFARFRTVTQIGFTPGTGEFPAQMASNAENVSIW